MRRPGYVDSHLARSESDLKTHWGKGRAKRWILCLGRSVEYARYAPHSGYSGRYPENREWGWGELQTQVRPGSAE